MVKLSPVCQTNLASQVKNNNIQLRHMRVIWWWCTEEEEGEKADREDRTWQGQRWRHRNSRTAQTLWLNSTFIYFPTKFAGRPVTRCHVTDRRSLLLLSGSAWTCLFFVPGGSSILLPQWSEEPHTKWPTYISSVRLKVTENTTRLSANNSSSPVKSTLLNKQNTPWSLVKYNSCGDFGKLLRGQGLLIRSVTQRHWHGALHGKAQRKRSQNRHSSALRLI